MCKIMNVNYKKTWILQKPIRELANLYPTDGCRKKFKSQKSLTVNFLIIHSVAIYIDQSKFTREKTTNFYNTQRTVDYSHPTKQKSS